VPTFTWHRSGSCWLGLCLSHASGLASFHPQCSERGDAALRTEHRRPCGLRSCPQPRCVPVPARGCMYMYIQGGRGQRCHVLCGGCRVPNKGFLWVAVFLSRPSLQQGTLLPGGVTGTGGAEGEALSHPPPRSLPSPHCSATPSNTRPAAPTTINTVINRENPVLAHGTTPAAGAVAGGLGYPPSAATPRPPPAWAARVSPAPQKPSTLGRGQAFSPRWCCPGGR